MTVARPLALATGVLLVAAMAVGPVLAAGVAVSIVGKAYEPATITINQGDTVTWTVTESVGEPHSVTSGTLQLDAGKIFDSGIESLQDDGETFQWTFDDAGEFAYFCTVHPIEMTGKVVVLAPGASVPPSIAPPPSEHDVGVPVERRALAGGILAVSIVLMFLGAWLWRRMNPA
jgi:plastocyanin